MTETELKPCPFCGGKPNLRSYSKSRNWIVFCSKCETETQVYESEQKAVKAWNSRPIEDAQDKEITRLREALAEIEDAITLLNTADVLEHISDKIKQALKGEKE